MNIAQEENKLITYDGLLQRLENNKRDHHLLLGNGFNISLKIDTSYENIFSKIKKSHPEYLSIEARLKEDNFDIEKLPRQLMEVISNASKSRYEFIKRRLEDEIKQDFIYAAMKIITEGFDKKDETFSNKGVFKLLDHFTNYFTLNYDPLLYLLLLEKIKLPEILALMNKNLFVSDQGEYIHPVYKYSKRVYFEIMRDWAKKEWSDYAIYADYLIGKSYDHLTNEEKNSNGDNAQASHTHNDAEETPDLFDLPPVESSKETIPYDGFSRKEKYLYTFDASNQQNLYFLHGAFHIVERNNTIQRITRTEKSTFQERVAQEVYTGWQKMVIVFSGTSEEKKNQIQNSTYLEKGFDVLPTLSGDLTIFGSSLDKNDNHIFEQINKSAVETIYLSSCSESYEEDKKRAKELFGNKKIVLFDYTTVSYTKTSTT